ncbi:MAG: TonB-dependent receptor [Prevotellaceae bacterium]|nr:TonB-dependent receptor [Prevotellaceae bacterium]
MKTRLLIVVFQILVSGFFAEAREISGIVRDAETSNPVEGAIVLIKNTDKGATTNVEGYYNIRNLSAGSYILEVSALSYRTFEMDFEILQSDTVMDIYIESEDIVMDAVVVSARQRSNTENAIMQIVKTLPQVASGISAAQIARSPDRVASEVIRRAPGVTIIDDRLIIVRGLSQRYNNAWINGMTAPSTETDSRAFPFDLVPGSQIDNLMVYKSPSPDIPGDFSGGFVKITSKSVPDENSIQAGYTTGFNVATQFDVFHIGEGGATDFLGFDNNMRTLSKDFPEHLGAVNNPDEITRLTKEGFNTNWKVRNIIPVPDQRFFLTLARRIETKSNRTVGNLTSLNYSNTFKSVHKMKNARYGIYNYTEDTPVYLYDYVDNQFSNDARLGVLHNWSFVINPSNRIEFKNLLNILGRNRLTKRTGIKDVSSMYYYEQTEIQYSSRLIYSGQFSGTHELGDGVWGLGNRVWGLGDRVWGLGNRDSHAPNPNPHTLNPNSPNPQTLNPNAHTPNPNSPTLSWDIGYSFASKNEPDRRIVVNYAGIGNEEDIPFVTTHNDNISRYFHNLYDNIFSAALNYRHTFDNIFLSALKTGFYGEYQDRDYAMREFIYRYNKLSYEERQTYLSLPFAEMFDNRYLGADKVYVDEITKKTNNYSANVLHAAGYAVFEIPVNNLAIYAGVRFENRRTKLTNDRSMNPAITLDTTKIINELDWLPSVNLVYRFSERHQLRAAYGRSVNRPELRELSPSVYYDFDLFSEIGGNENLKTAKIDNIDLRYEFYPALGETVSLGIFYKYFRNPIEWTFIDMGGSWRYSYENAGKAVSRGIELDVRKKLDFIGLPALSATMNVALISSRVHFEPGEVVSEPDRAMQGQSPYVINAGIYYASEKAGLNISALYNRIGKRIVGLGKSNVPDQIINNMVPDSYEMPRNMLDLSIIKTIGKHCELRCSIRDILAEDIVFKQFPKFEKDNAIYKREQTTKRFNQGQFVSLGVSIKY